MRAFDNATFLISKLGVASAVIILLLMSILVLVEIVLRTVFSLSTHMLDELVGYGIGGMTFLALGYSFEKGALIRMNLLLARLNPRSLVRRAVEVLCCLFGLVATGIAGFYFGHNVWRNFQRGYISETVAEVPLWIPEGLLLLGLVVFWLQLLSYLLRVLSGRMDLGAERAADFGYE